MFQFQNYLLKNRCSLHRQRLTYYIDDIFIQTKDPCHPANTRRPCAVLGL